MGLWWPSIVRLFLARSPSTVAGHIGTVIIDAVYRKMRSGSPSHVRKEVGELLPALTNVNSTSSIARKLWVVRILATLSDFDPGSPFRRMRASMRAVMGDMPTHRAPTATLVPVGYLISPSDGLFAAVAATPIEATLATNSFFNVGETQHEKFAEFLAREIARFRSHGFYFKATAKGGQWS